MTFWLWLIPTLTTLACWWMLRGVLIALAENIAAHDHDRHGGPESQGPMTPLVVRDFTSVRPDGDARADAARRGEVPQTDGWF